MTNRSEFFKKHNDNPNPTHLSHSRKFKENTLAQFRWLQKNFGEGIKG